MKYAIALCALLATPALAEDTGALLHVRAQALADAIAPGRADVWAAMLDDAMLMTDENGTVTDKAQSVKAIQPLPKGSSGHINVTDWRANVTGGTAVSTQVDDEYEDYHGQKLHAKYAITCGWVRRGADWKLLSMQVLALNQDPPAIGLPASLTDQYLGRYSGGPGLSYVIARTKAGLTGRREGGKPVALKAELADVLFVPGQPRIRDIFRRDAHGRIIGFVSRREARDVVFRKVG